MCTCTNFIFPLSTLLLFLSSSLSFFSFLLDLAFDFMMREKDSTFFAMHLVVTIATRELIDARRKWWCSLVRKE